MLVRPTFYLKVLNAFINVVITKTSRKLTIEEAIGAKCKCGINALAHVSLTF